MEFTVGKTTEYHLWYREWIMAVLRDALLCGNIAVLMDR